MYENYNKTSVCETQKQVSKVTQKFIGEEGQATNVRCTTHNQGNVANIMLQALTIRPGYYPKYSFSQALQYYGSAENQIQDVQSNNHSSTIST